MRWLRATRALRCALRYLFKIAKSPTQGRQTVRPAWLYERHTDVQLDIWGANYVREWNRQYADARRHSGNNSEAAERVVELRQEILDYATERRRFFYEVLYRYRLSFLEFLKLI